MIDTEINKTTAATENSNSKKAAESPYNIGLYGLDKNFIQEVQTLNETKSTIGIFANWTLMIGLILFSSYAWTQTWFWYAYVPLAFAIAARQGAFLQLVHEACHSALSKNKKLNDFYGSWMLSLPVGVSYEGYCKGHLQHHAYTGTDKDPKSDSEKYKVVDLRNPKLYMLFLKDLLGITALYVFFSYEKNENQQAKAAKTGSEPSMVATLAKMILCQVIMLAIFQFKIELYILLWAVPAACCHMFLMRIRGMAEHGLAKQLQTQVNNATQGNFYTRSFGTPVNQYGFKPMVWFERFLIGSFNVYYHHEHHIMPLVPYYNLPKVHEKIATKAHSMNPEIYAKGYFAAAMKSIINR